MRLKLRFHDSYFVKVAATIRQFRSCLDAGLDPKSWPGINNKVEWKRVDRASERARSNQAGKAKPSQAKPSQARKQTNKQASKQASKQATSKQASKIDRQIDG